MKNSIEEDIKILEEIIKGDEDCINAIYSQMKVKNDNDEDIQYYKKEIQAIQHILSDYKRVLKENEKKDKIIDLMIKVMIDSSICDYFIKEKCKNYAGDNGKTCDNCIKQYFENKAKEV